MRRAVANGHDMEPWSTDDPAEFSVSYCLRCGLRMYDMPDICGITALTVTYTCEEGPAVNERLWGRIIDACFNTPTVLIEDRRDGN